MDRRAIIPWVVIIVLVMLGFIIFMVRLRSTDTTTEKSQEVSNGQTTETTNEENLTNIEPTTVNTEESENLALATSLAKKWKEDAQLVYVQVKLTSLTPEQGTEIYVFNAPSVPDAHFTFTLSQQSQAYIRAVIPKEDYLGYGLLAIDQKYWKLNYVTAFQTAEKQGGKEFREQNSDWFLEIDLKRGEPENWLYYTVNYKSKSGNTLSVKINPFYGDVVTEGTTTESEKSLE